MKRRYTLTEDDIKTACKEYVEKREKLHKVRMSASLDIHEGDRGHYADSGRYVTASVDVEE